MNQEVSLIYSQYLFYSHVRLDACKTCQIVEANFLGSLANKRVSASSIYVEYPKTVVSYDSSEPTLTLGTVSEGYDKVC